MGVTLILKDGKQSYLTISEKIPPDLMITSEHISKDVICKLHRNEKFQPSQLQHRINPNYKAITEHGFEGDA